MSERVTRRTAVERRRRFTVIEGRPAGIAVHDRDARDAREEVTDGGQS
jgi:hypothetical protein